MTTLAELPPSTMQSNADRVLVSILNWNGTADTLRCLQGIDRSQCPDLQFAVLDNGSAQDPSAQFQAQCPDVLNFRVPRNLGFAGGHNWMIKWAMQQGYGAVLILNNDCEIDVNAILALKQQLDSDPQIAVASCVIYRSGAVRRPMMVSGWIDWARQLSVRPNSPDAKPPAGEPMLLVGTALLLRCAALQTIGLLDERYFAYYEDNDLSARVAAAGLKSVYCKDSICLHHYRPLHEYSAMALYLMSRNQWLFWREHTPEACKPGMTRRLTARSLHDLALLKKNQVSRDKTQAVVAGWWDAMHGRYGAPPTKLVGPAWLHGLAMLSPYLASRLLLAPLATLRRKLGAQPRT
ncbi:glycosyltransferase family 2 protein [Roseateles microcysteis]|uniref:glycosyltransferase family 2 protein n=1 Tax=Roseateles microcysteis TaxID=3119057 RepID=UPI002FE50A54